MKMFAVLLGLSLTACSMNLWQQPMGPSLQKIQNMDANDKNYMYQAMDYNPTGRVSTWTNARLHRAYSVLPMSGMMSVNKNPNCRKFKVTVTTRGQSEDVYGFACRQDNGSWRTVGE